MNCTRFVTGSLAAFAIAVLSLGCTHHDHRVEGAASGPRYQVDPFWPKPLPNAWIMGQVAGIATDSRGQIWVLHRPGSLTDDEKGATLNPPTIKCCRPAPPVLVFDAQGNLLRSWGGPGTGYNWPKNEHGIHVDANDNVWLGGNDMADHMVLKFTLDGKFLLQIGKPGLSGGSNATDQLGRPAHMEVDAAANELFIADGYQNRRVIVFDATSGLYKRHWGANGSRPDDRKIPPHNVDSQQFGNPVHCVRLTRDGLVYVCDRTNNRIQVFRRDGRFVFQFVLEPNTLAQGSVWDMVPSEDAEQKYLLVADGANNEVHILVRVTGERIGAFGRSGRNAGDFHWVHNIAVDAKGSLYTSEVDTAKRVQKFRRVN